MLGRIWLELEAVPAGIAKIAWLHRVRDRHPSAAEVEASPRRSIVLVWARLAA
jgi:hypothetical protein